MITERKINTDDRVRFKSYEEYNDWKEHRGEMATVMEVFPLSSVTNFDYAVKWDDNRISYTHGANLIMVAGDWDV